VANLVAYAVPRDATVEAVRWASSDTAVAVVDEDGRVTALSNGEATITATVGGLTATTTVTVQERVVAMAPVVMRHARGADYTVGQDYVAPLTFGARVTDGGTLSYAWFDHPPAAGDTPLGVGAAYTPPVSAAGRFFYYVAVTNTLGEAATTVVCGGIRVTVRAGAPSGVSPANFAAIIKGNPKRYQHLEDAIKDATTTDTIEVYAGAKLAQIGTTTGGLDRNYELMEDIIEPVSRPISPSLVSAAPFTGLFDGKGHTVTLAIIYSATPLTPGVDHALDAYTGLFARLDGGAIVSNLKLKGSVTPPNISAVSPVVNIYNFYAGAVAGESIAISVKINAVTSDVEVDGSAVIAMRSNYIGGIVGVNGGEISACSSTGDITSAKVAFGNTGDILENYAGGIAGSSSNTITNCYTTGKVSIIEGVDCDGSIKNGAGGIAGYVVGGVSYCYATGSITSKAGSYKGNVANYAGGIVGWNAVSRGVANCVALNDIITVFAGDSPSASQGPGSFAGRVVGQSKDGAGNTINDGFVYCFNKNMSTIYGGGAGGSGTQDGFFVSDTDIIREWWWRSNFNTGGPGFAFGSSVGKPWKWNTALHRPCFWWQ
jgi:hypothetical protein